MYSKAAPTTTWALATLFERCRTAKGHDTTVALQLALVLRVPMLMPTPIVLEGLLAPIPSLANPSHSSHVQ